MSNLVINMEVCISCDICIDICAKEKAISKDGSVYKIDQDKCVQCGACVQMCMVQAISKV